MSRIAKKPITIPEGVTLKLEADLLTIKGPKGELNLKIHPLVRIEEKEKQIWVTVLQPEVKQQKALWGLFFRLIVNMLKGVTDGYEKKLEVVGIGFKVALQGNKLILHVGYSHPIEFVLPEGIKASIEKNTITLIGIDKQLIGEIAAQIRRIRKPEPYKGKGIKYSDEIIRKKVGKAAIKSAG